MTSILALPNELVLHVLKFTDLADLENLSQIKLNWYRAAIPLLRLHIERKRQYSYLSGRNHLWRDVVISILRDPDVAYYVRHLEVDYNTTTAQYKLSRRSSGLKYQHRLPVGSSDAKMIEERIKSSLSPLLAPRFDLQAYTADMNVTDEALATMLLYTLLPKLQTLTVICFIRRDAGLLSRTVQAIANAHRNNPENLKISALGELKYVDFHSHQEPPVLWSWDSIVTADYLYAFMTLPQISAFKFTNLKMPLLAQDAALSAYHLTSLIFVDYAMEQDGICSLLARVPCLRRFCYLQKHIKIAVDCDLIFSTLRTHHARSVRLIAFDANLKSHSSISVNLSAFEDLRMAYIPWAFLRSTLSCSLGAAILPKLRILSIPTEDSSISDAPKFFLSLLDEEWYSCPCLLSLLVLDGSYGTPAANKESLQDMLAAKGLSLITEEHDFATQILGALDEEWRAYI